MAFGFSGAHRTGKTTLAKQVAEDLKMQFLDGSVSKIMKEFGINAVGDIPLEQRIEAQEFLLKRYLDNLTKAPRPLITDRTPLDMIGYMLGEITMHNCSAEAGKKANAYVENCLDATLRHFDTVIIVGPLAGYTVDPKSPPPNEAYQRAVQFLIEGAACRIASSMYIDSIETTDFEARRECAGKIFGGRMHDIAQQSRFLVRH